MNHTDASASTASTASTAESASEHVSLKRWLAVVAVAVGTFLVVTAEQLPVGLLTSIGGDLGISKGTAGLMVTVPGLVASASALLVPVAIGRLDRRTVLLGLISLMVAANALSFLAPNFPILLASRFLVGISIGGFWALAAGIAVRLVPDGHVSRATSIAFGGATGPGKHPRRHVPNFAGRAGVEQLTLGRGGRNMASIIDRIKKLLRSPQGQKARARAERMARDPRTQAKARRLLARFRGGSRH